MDVLKRQAGIQGKEALRNAIKAGGESKFLKIKGGETATIRFLQEIDESGSLYDETRGVARGFYEHVNPDDYKQSFLCTLDEEGRCAGCERVPVNARWRAKGRLFVNVIQRGEDGVEDKVKIYTTSISSKGLADQLIEYSDENGSICDRDYKLKRTGDGMTDTRYTLTPRAPSPLKPTEEKAELVDLDTVIRNLNYEQQIELLSGEANSDW